MSDDLLADVRARAASNGKAERKGVQVSVTAADRDQLRHLQCLLFHRNSRETVATVLSGYLQHLGPDRLAALEKQHAEITSKNGSAKPAAKAKKSASS